MGNKGRKTCKEYKADCKAEREKDRFIKKAAVKTRRKVRDKLTRHNRIDQEGRKEGRERYLSGGRMGRERMAKETGRLAGMQEGQETVGQIVHLEYDVKPKCKIQKFT